MPQAPPFSHYDPQEFAFARTFVVDALTELGQEASVNEGSPAVIMSGRTVSVVPVKVDPNNNVTLLFNPADKSFMHGVAADWVVVVDVASSQMFAIKTARMTTPSESTGMLSHATAPSGWASVTVNRLFLENELAIKTMDVSVDGRKYLESRGRDMRQSEDFVHLHLHSMYSMLDGTMKPEQIAERVYRNGQPGVALTDHGYMFGCWKHFQACKDVGIKPILGIEAYVVDDVDYRYKRTNGTETRFEYHQTLIAMNQTGWENLCGLMSLACRDHYYYVPRIDHRLLLNNCEGIICLTGCFKGMAAHFLQHRTPREGETELPWWLRHDPDRARGILRAYKAAFGDRLYGEVMNIDFQQYMSAVPELMQVLDDEGIPKVITNDTHYEQGEDAVVQQLCAAIGGFSVGDGFGSQGKTGVYYIRERHEIEDETFTADMFDRTCEIMERCDLDIGFTGYLFPEYDLTGDRDWGAFQAQKETAR